jgi:hypothetical protein
MSLTSWKKTLYAQVHRQPDELAMAAQLLFGGPPPEEHTEDFLDFFALEWVDAQGLTLLQRLVAEGTLPPALEAWSAEVVTALWVVDGWAGQRVLVRDLATDAEYAVEAAGLQAELPKRMVLRARLIPHEGSWIFSGSPELVEPLGVIARLDLLRRWMEGPEPGLLERLSQLRRLYRQLREEREAWVAYFGKEEVTFSGPEHLSEAMSGMVNHLFNVWPFVSLGGLTRAAARRNRTGRDPEIIQFQLGGVLAGPGRHAAIYDAVEGIHFLPSFGELRAHLRGEEHHPQLLREYLEDPHIGLLPFKRLGETAALARVLGRPEAPVEELLAGIKTPAARWTIHLLPGMDD